MLIDILFTFGTAGFLIADSKQFLAELEMAKMEIYRRYVVPYGDEKIKENGDVE
jgi:hypothetical protein